jgi:two-component system, NtrC family, response regulator HydG
MREINPKAKIVIMTAYCEEEKLGKVTGEGAYETLYKPVDIPRLMDILGELTDTPPILVVDDDDNFRLSLAHTLETQEYKVTAVASGTEAIKMAQHKVFDIAFIDIKMSVMDGLATSLKLKEIKPDMLVIMMTGYRDEVQDIVEIAMKKGVLKCLYKPFNFAEVRELVGRTV